MARGKKPKASDAIKEGDDVDQLFGHPFHAVTSSIRAKWPPTSLEVFQSFVRAAREDGIASYHPNIDIAPLIKDLGLAQFTLAKNSFGDTLGPIIAVKVHRKLRDVWSQLSPAPTKETNVLKKTTNLDMMAGALTPEKAGEAPVPRAHSIPAASKNKGKGRSSGPSFAVKEAQKEVDRLMKALQNAMKNLDIAKQRDSCLGSDEGDNSDGK